MLGMEPNTIPAQACSMMQREPDHSGICPHPSFPLPQRRLLHPSSTAKSKKTWKVREGGAQAAWLALRV